MSSEWLPLFPLAQVVLFPHSRCPLHVFEARYRQMTADALREGGRIGTIAVRPEHVEELSGDPPLFSVGCEGKIVESSRLADGRYNIVLAGERRFRILAERARPAERLYRTARVEYLEEDALAHHEETQLVALRARALEIVGELLERSTPGAGRRLEPRLLGGDDTGVVNSLCQVLDLPLREKQGLLEAAGPLPRARALVGLLEFRRAELDAGLVPPSHTVH